jgi:hypothetical protein
MTTTFFRITHDTLPLTIFVEHIYTCISVLTRMVSPHILLLRGRSGTSLWGVWGGDIPFQNWKVVGKIKISRLKQKGILGVFRKKKS